MSILHLELGPGSCIEVCEGDRLIGYVIWFSGGWDCYAVGNALGDLCKFGSNVQDRNEAILTVKRRAME